MRSVLDGHDTLGLMPTGGGKSVAFQVPGLVLGGLTVVVTPLISLMKDQVDNLRARRVKAVFFHSAMSSREIRMAWEISINFENINYKFKFNYDTYSDFMSKGFNFKTMENYDLC